MRSITACERSAKSGDTRELLSSRYAALTLFRSRFSGWSRLNQACACACARARSARRARSGCLPLAGSPEMSLEAVVAAAPGLGFCGVLIDHGLGDALDHRLRALRKVWRNARAAEVQVCRIDLVQV